ASALDALLLENGRGEVTQCEMSTKEPAVTAFLGKQVHIATEQFGKIDPLDLDEYVEHGGFRALARCLRGVKLKSVSVCHVEKNNELGKGITGNGCRASSHALTESTDIPLGAEQIIEIIEKSGLRGRGGAGFPTGSKWRLAHKQPSPAKYVICN